MEPREEAIEQYKKAMEGYESEITQLERFTVGAGVHAAHECKAYINSHARSIATGAFPKGVDRILARAEYVKRWRCRLRLLLSGVSPQEAKRRTELSRD